MILLTCLFCEGELVLLQNDRAVHKKVECKKCGFTNVQQVTKKEPEIITLRRRK